MHRTRVTFLVARLSTIYVKYELPKQMGDGATNGIRYESRSVRGYTPSAVQSLYRIVLCPLHDGVTVFRQRASMRNANVPVAVVQDLVAQAADVDVVATADEEGLCQLNIRI
jgi:hypothetical protein